VSPYAGPGDVVSPGHVFPICARKGGVLVRSGQTEGSVDLARLAGLEPSGVICEIMKDDGTMARMPDLEQFAEDHELGILTIAQLIEYRVQRESLVRQSARASVLPAGLESEFQVVTFKTEVSDAQYMALVLGDVKAADNVLVRMHRACVPGDVFGIDNCTCADNKQKALEMIAEAGAGVFVYILPGKMDLSAQVQTHVAGPKDTEDKGEEGIPPELRDFGLGAQVLANLGLSKIRLVTNNPKRIVGLRAFGLEVVERVSL